MSDHPTPSIEELWQIVQEQGAELAGLRAQRRDPSPVLSGRPISRAGLFNAAAAGAVLAAGSELVVAPSAALADGTERATTFSTSAGIGVTVKCTSSTGTGIEVQGPGSSEASDYWGIYSAVTNGLGVLATSQNSTAVQATSYSTTAQATAVLGVIGSTMPGGFSSAVRGQNKGTGGLGIGVWGSHAGSGWGGYFTSASGNGVNAVGGTGTGVNASGATGVSAFGNTVGVAAASAGGTGVTASGHQAGVNAQAFAGFGVLGRVGAGPTLPSTQAGVAGQASGGFPGVVAASDTGPGVSAVSTSGPGLTATSQTGGAGVKGISHSGYGVQAQGGRAQLYLVPAGTAGAPTAGSHYMGELFLDKNGALYLCVVKGTAGTWKRVAVTAA